MPRFSNQMRTLPIQLVLIGTFTVISCLGFSSPAQAQLLPMAGILGNAGQQNYEDCILNNMKGVQSDIAAQAILDAHALTVRAYITHGVLSGKACKRIEDSVLEECVITDSIEFSCPNDCKKTRVVSVCHLIGEAMRRVSNEESVSSLFTQKIS